MEAAVETKAPEAEKFDPLAGMNYPSYVHVNARGVAAIMKCLYLKRKGKPATEEVYVWTDALSERINEFEPVKGAPPKVDLTNRQRDIGDLSATPRMALLLEAIASLDPEQDFTPQGYPSIDALRIVSGLDVSLDERNEAWARFDKTKPKMTKKKEK